MLQEIKARFDAVPELYLTSIENKDGQITITGESPNEAAVTKFGQSLEFSNGTFSNLYIETERRVAKVEEKGPAVPVAELKPEVIAFRVMTYFGPSKSQVSQPAPSPANEVAKK